MLLPGVDDISSIELQNLKLVAFDCLLFSLLFCNDLKIVLALELQLLLEFIQSRMHL